MLEKGSKILLLPIVGEKWHTRALYNSFLGTPVFTVPGSSPFPASLDSHSIHQPFGTPHHMLNTEVSQILGFSS